MEVVLDHTHFLLNIVIHNLLMHYLKELLGLLKNNLDVLQLFVLFLDHIHQLILIFNGDVILLFYQSF